MRCLLALCIAVTQAAWAGPAPVPLEKIKVGLFDVAPYVVASGGKPRGALVDFLEQEIAPRMGVKFVFETPVTIARLEKNLASGHFMFTPLLVRTAEREKGGIVYATPAHIQFEPCVAVLPDAPLQKIASAKDLQGMKIGWVQGAAITEFMRDPAITLDPVGMVDWERTNLDKLRLGRIQGAYFSDGTTPRYMAKKMNMALRCVKLPVPGRILFGAFAPNTPPALIERYRKAAEEAFANGRFESYISKLLDTPLP